MREEDQKAKARELCPESYITVSHPLSNVQPLLEPATHSERPGATISRTYESTSDSRDHHHRPGLEGGKEAHWPNGMGNAASPVSMRKASRAGVS